MTGLPDGGHVAQRLGRDGQPVAHAAADDARRGRPGARRPRRRRARSCAPPSRRAAAARGWRGRSPPRARRPHGRGAASSGSASSACTIRCDLVLAGAAGAADRALDLLRACRRRRAAPRWPAASITTPRAWPTANADARVLRRSRGPRPRAPPARARRAARPRGAWIAARRALGSAGRRRLDHAAVEREQAPAAARDDAVARVARCRGRCRGRSSGPGFCAPGRTPSSPGPGSRDAQRRRAPEAWPARRRGPGAGHRAEARAAPARRRPRRAPRAAPATVDHGSLRLSVLDQSPIAEGSSGAQALHDTLDLARLADELGYHRYWVAEHHGGGSWPAPSPEVLIGPSPRRPGALRVGSGGVMLPHYSPLKVAESFSVLSGAVPRAHRPRPRPRGGHGPDDHLRAPARPPPGRAGRLPRAARGAAGLPRGRLPLRPPLRAARRRCPACRRRRSRGCSGSSRRARSGPASSASRTPSRTSSTARAHRSPPATAPSSTPGERLAAPRTAVAVWALARGGRRGGACA